MVVRSGIFIGGYVDGELVPKDFLDAYHFTVRQSTKKPQDPDFDRDLRNDVVELKIYYRLVTHENNVWFVHFYDPDMALRDARNRAFRWHETNT